MPEHAIRNPSYGKAHRQSKPAPPGFYGDTDCGAPARRLVEVVDLADVPTSKRCLRCWPTSHHPRNDETTESEGNR